MRGYWLRKTEELELTLYAGPGYKIERFFGDETDDQPIVAFGGGSYVLLPYAAEIEAWAEYLPAMLEWERDYLVRSELSLLVPLWAMISFKSSLYASYDSTPTPDTDHTKLTTSVGLAVDF